MRKRDNAAGKGDVLFLAAVLLLAAYGVVCVYSASCYNAQVQYGDGAFFFRKQLVGFVLGAAAMVGLSFLPYEKLRRAGLPALVVSLVLLALVFVPGLGKSNYDALDRSRPDHDSAFRAGQARICAVCGGIFCQRSRADAHASRVSSRSRGGARRVRAHHARTQYVGHDVRGRHHDRNALSRRDLQEGARLHLYSRAAGTPRPHRNGAVPPAAAFGVHGSVGRLRKRRGISSSSPLYGLANGNLFGVGLFRSRQKFRFLPFAESDFILSVIAEETGFFGVLALFALIGSSCGGECALPLGAEIFTGICSRAGSRSPLPCSARSTRWSSAGAFRRRDCLFRSSRRGTRRSL